jgi:hypothetical protein
LRVNFDEDAVEENTTNDFLGKNPRTVRVENRKLVGPIIFGPIISIATTAYLLKMKKNLKSYQKFFSESLWERTSH